MYIQCKRFTNLMSVRLAQACPNYYYYYYYYYNLSIYLVTQETEVLAHVDIPPVLHYSSPVFCTEQLDP